MAFTSFHASAQADFNPAPSRDKETATRVHAAKALPKGVGSAGVFVGVDGDVPRDLGLDRETLSAAGFEGKVGQTLIVPRPGGPTLVAIGVGERGELDAAKLRDAVAAFARAAAMHPNLALHLIDTDGLRPGAAAQAAVEGALLARYRYRPLKRPLEKEPPLAELTLITSAPPEEIDKGMARGMIAARAQHLARDLANAPATLLTARKMAEIAKDVAAATGLEIEIFDEKALAKLGAGGILGVNAGSAEPPRLIKLTYRPKKGEPIGRVALVGKGIMYDSGGISLKPNDLIHAAMKTDMSGAASVLASMATLSALGCKSEVIGYMCCTDNMPSGSAMKLGDVLTVRGGTTIEVLNTDAEGRLVMADGLVLATEQKPKPDAIVDIATLTGAAQRALGGASAAVVGNQQELVDQVKRAADQTDETVWQLPLDRRYRKELESDIADLKNVGGEHAGTITAALFLDEFTSGIPWAHIDIAGTAKVDADDSWRSKGATGFGTRLLIDFLMAFTPTQTRH